MELFKDILSLILQGIGIGFILTLLITIPMIGPLILWSSLFVAAHLFINLSAMGGVGIAAICLICFTVHTMYQGQWYH